MPAEHTHSPTPEDIMEYVDGEGTAASRATIATHLASCAACQAIAAEQRDISEHARAWTVESAPVTLQPPTPPRARVLLPFIGAWRPSRTARVGLAAAAVLVLGVWSISISQLKPARSPALSIAAESSADTPMARAQKMGPDGASVPQVLAGRAQRGGVVGGVPRPAVGAPAVGMPQTDALRGPMVIRTATLRVVAKDFGGVRAAVEAVVSQAGGFIDQMTVTGDNATARELRGTLRVPGDRMAAALASLRALGQVVEDTQGSQEVTDEIIDLDARLASSRATEKRLTELLANRTGKLSDVLEVEREITRVRLDIERLDAEKTNLGRRVSYATIAITVAEERKEGLVGPLSLATRLRVAAADGLETALDTVTALILFVLRAGPTLVLFSLAAGIAWWIGRRILRTTDSPIPRVSE